jgi:hypothetical protein
VTNTGPEGFSSTKKEDLSQNREQNLKKQSQLLHPSPYGLAGLLWDPCAYSISSLFLGGSVIFHGSLCPHLQSPGGPGMALIPDYSLCVSQRKFFIERFWAPVATQKTPYPGSNIHPGSSQSQTGRQDYLVEHDVLNGETRKRCLEMGAHLWHNWHNESIVQITESLANTGLPWVTAESGTEVQSRVLTVGAKQVTEWTAAETVRRSEAAGRLCKDLVQTLKKALVNLIVVTRQKRKKRSRVTNSLSRNHVETEGKGESRGGVRIFMRKGKW